MTETERAELLLNGKVLLGPNAPDEQLDRFVDYVYTIKQEVSLGSQTKILTKAQSEGVYNKLILEHNSKLIQAGKKNASPAKPKQNLSFEQRLREINILIEKILALNIEIDVMNSMGAIDGNETVATTNLKLATLYGVS